MFSRRLWNLKGRSQMPDTFCVCSRQHADRMPWCDNRTGAETGNQKDYKQTSHHRHIGCSDANPASIARTRSRFFEQAVVDHDLVEHTNRCSSVALVALNETMELKAGAPAHENERADTATERGRRLYADGGGARTCQRSPMNGRWPVSLRRQWTNLPVPSRDRNSLSAATTSGAFRQSARAVEALLFAAPQLLVAQARSAGSAGPAAPDRSSGSRRSSASGRRRTAAASRGILQDVTFEHPPQADRGDQAEDRARPARAVSSRSKASIISTP